LRKKNRQLALEASKALKIAVKIVLNFELIMLEIILETHEYQVLLGALAAVALGHTSEPVDANSQEDVDNDVDPHDAKVAPGILVVADDLGKEDIGGLDGAVRAIGGGIVVQEVSTGQVDVGLHVLEAGLAVWRVEVQVLDALAGGCGAGDTR
jgi:hypothetical protein